MNKKYTIFSFIFDMIMCVFTGGLWLIWMMFREMRRNHG